MSFLGGAGCYTTSTYPTLIDFEVGDKVECCVERAQYRVLRGTKGTIVHLNVSDYSGVGNKYKWAWL